MQRRKYLAALGSLAAGGAAIGGTGAFSSTAAGRNVSLSVAGDRGAYLGLEPGDSPHAYTDSDGSLVLDFDGSQVSGNGINTDAFVKFNKLFTIRNNTSETIAVWLDDGASGNPSVNNGNSADFVQNLNGELESYQFFWSFSREDQSDYYANSKYGYKVYDNSVTATNPNREEDTNGNDLEYGLNDSGVLAPTNVAADATGIFSRTRQHPAVLGSGDKLSINFAINTDLEPNGNDASIDPNAITNLGGDVVLNGYTQDFAQALQP